MLNTAIFKLMTPVAAALSLTVLAGCTGTSTYGTGVTQEAQLLKDVTNMVALGSSEKKAPINYQPRPGLVDAPATGTLPTPLEDDGNTEAGYFPQDQEAIRTRLLRESESKNPVVRRKALAELKRRYKPQPGGTNAYEAPETYAARAKKNARNFQADGNDFNPELARRQREEFLKQQAALKGTRGAAPRKYLTEPPSEYRTPANTAAVGVTGEQEKTEAQKNRTPLIDLSRERGIFGKKEGS